MTQKEETKLYELVHSLQEFRATADILANEAIEVRKAVLEINPFGGSGSDVARPKALFYFEEIPSDALDRARKSSAVGDVSITEGGHTSPGEWVVGIEGELLHL